MIITKHNKIECNKIKFITSELEKQTNRKKKSLREGTRIRDTLKRTIKVLN